MNKLLRYNKFDVKELVDQALRKNRVDAEVALDLLIEIKRQLEHDENIYNRRQDPIEDAKAMCAEDVL